MLVTPPGRAVMQLKTDRVGSCVAAGEAWGSPGASTSTDAATANAAGGPSATAARVIWTVLALLVCGIATLPPAVAVSPNFADVTPSPQQVRWQDLEFGVLIHFGTNTFLGLEWGDGTAKPSVFNPDSLDAEQWAAA